MWNKMIKKLKTLGKKKQAIIAFSLLLFAVLLIVPMVSPSYAVSYNGDGNGTGWWKATFSSTAYTWTAKKSNTTSTLVVSGKGSAKGYYGKSSSASTYTIWMAYYIDLTKKNNGSVSGAWDRILYSSGTEKFKTSTKSGKLYKGGSTYSFSIGSSTISWSRGTSAKSHTVDIGVRTNKNGISSKRLGTFTVPTKEYTVTFKPNGGSGGPSSQQKVHGSTLTLTSSKPTRTGYTFYRWCTKSDGSGTCYASGGKFTTNANTTLYAKWTANTLTITYNANGGKIADSPHKSGDYYYRLSSNIAQRSTSSSSGFANLAHKITYNNKVNLFNFSTFNITRDHYHRVDGAEWRTTSREEQALIKM